MPDFFCSFGFGQEHYPGYVRVTAPDHHTARDLMFEKYGRKWCTSHCSLENLHALDRIERDHIVMNETEKNG